MSELERLRDRVEELERALGMTDAKLIPPEIFAGTGRGPMLCKFTALVLARKIGAREAMYVAFYGHLPEVQPPDIKVLDQYAFHVRACLKPYGIHLFRLRGVGWYFDRDGKENLRSLIARLNDEPVAA